jgi:hypothetical protein
MIQTVLTLAELRTADPLAQEREGETRFCCPLCGSGKPVDNAHRSLSANLKTGVWKCHRCEEGGVLLEFRTERTEEPRRFSRNDRARSELRQRTKLSTPIEIRQIDPEKDTKWRAYAKGSTPIVDTPAADYLASRQIPIDTAKAARVRYYANWYGHPAVLFPAYDHEGKLVATQGRFINGKTDPKTITGGPIGQGAFATSGAWDSDLIIIAEAPIDALTLAAAGFPSIALCGKELRRWIIERCIRKNVALAFDSDPAGDQAAEKWTLELRKLRLQGAQIHRLRPPDGVKDWNELACQSDTIEKGIELVKQAIMLECPNSPQNTPSQPFYDSKGTSPPKSPQGPSELLLEVYRLIDNGADQQHLTTSINAFKQSCDLPNGYTDPQDPFAEDAISGLVQYLGQNG